MLSTSVYMVYRGIVLLVQYAFPRFYSMVHRSKHTCLVSGTDALLANLAINFGKNGRRMPSRGISDSDGNNVEDSWKHWNSNKKVLKNWKHWNSSKRAYKEFPKTSNWWATN